MNKQKYIETYIDNITKSNRFSSLNKYYKKELEKDFKEIGGLNGGTLHHIEHLENILTKRNKLIKKLRKLIK